jgi:YjbE family integral membrane protein
MDDALTAWAVPSLTSVLQVVAVDLMLGADNAMVIALACRNLPPRLRWHGVAWGALAVFLVRATLTLAALALLQLPYLRIVGAVLLLAVAVKLVRSPHEPGDPEVAASRGLLGVVATVVVADAIMSVDNVLAVAAAAQGQPAAVGLGLLVSIPVMVLFSRAILGLLTRYPRLVWVGAAFIAWVAVRTAASDPALARLIS